MITKIGLVAGEIWNYLDQHLGCDLLSSVIKGVAKDRDTVLMSIGWLAREGHVVLENAGAGDYMVRLSSR